MSSNFQNVCLSVNVFFFLSTIHGTILSKSPVCCLLDSCVPVKNSLLMRIVIETDSALPESFNEQQNKLMDLESRSRCQNIRIIGIPIGTEKGKPIEFITKLIPNLQCCRIPLRISLPSAISHDHGACHQDLQQPR